MIVSGMAWLSETHAGSFYRKEQTQFENLNLLYDQLEVEGFFSTPLKWMRAFSLFSKRFCLTSALALRDAADAEGLKKLDSAKCGILSLNREGVLHGNLEFFRDYIESGRKMARGNLFIHTLPTSPLAQAAMMFGFKGPNFHLSAERPRLGLLMERAEAQARRIPGGSFLCGMGGEKAAVCFFLQDAAGCRGEMSVSRIAEMAGHLEEPSEIMALIHKLSSAMEKL